MADGDPKYPLLDLSNLDVCRAYFKTTYCLKPILTHDGISVRFRQRDFGHVIQESSNRGGVKDTFSPERAKRLQWIKIALQDTSLEFKAGWDAKKKRYDHKSRVTLVIQNFVVVVRLKSASEADFVTSYVADSPRTQRKLRTAPKWINPFV